MKPLERIVFGPEAGAVFPSCDTSDGRNLDAGFCFGGAGGDSKRRRQLQQLHRRLRSAGRQRDARRTRTHFVSHLLLGHVRHRVGDGHREHRSCRGNCCSRHIRSVFRFCLKPRGQRTLFRHCHFPCHRQHERLSGRYPYRSIWDSPEQYRRLWKQGSRGRIGSDQRRNES